MQTKASDPLSVTRTVLVRAIVAGHPLVLLLGDNAGLNTDLLASASRDLAAAGRAVRPVRADTLRRTDLADADPNIVVAVDGAHHLPRTALLALDEHLRSPTATQLLLAGSFSFRTVTAAPGLSRLHFAPLVVHVPPLDDRDAAAFLRARGARVRPGVIRAAAGDPALLERFARPRLVSRLAVVAEAPFAAWSLDRPAFALTVCALLAAAALAVANPALLRPETTTSPPGWAATPPILPPTQAPGRSDTDGAVTDSTDDVDGSGGGITIDHEDPEDRLSPRLMTPRPGETLLSVYARTYHGLPAAPSIATIRSLNPQGPKPGGRLIFPAPATGWPPP